MRIQEFFVRVCVCVCVGGGSRLLNLFLSLKRGPMVLLHIFQGGGGPTFSRGGGPIETHIIITCDFPRGLDPLSPSKSAHGHCGILA